MPRAQRTSVEPETRSTPKPPETRVYKRAISGASARGVKSVGASKAKKPIRQTARVSPAASKIISAKQIGRVSKVVKVGETIGVVAPKRALVFERVGAPAARLPGRSKEPVKEVLISIGGKSSEYQKVLLAALAEAVLKVDESAGRVDDVAARMIASIPRSSPWDEAIGPFYETAALATWLGLTRQRIHQLASSNDILALKTGDGKTTLYPAWQFGRQGEMLPGLREVLTILQPALDSPWTVAGWLNAHSESEPSAAELLKAGETEHVLDEARDDARHLSQ